jgi:hypothetical protein
MAEPEPPPTDDLEDLPIKRDYGFLVKLILALLVGLAAALVIGWKMQSAAAHCGANLVRPGSTVVPPQNSAPTGPAPAAPGNH